MSYSSKLYKKGGGTELVIPSGGKLTVESGATVTLAAGTVTVDGSAGVTASAAEINILDGALLDTAELNLLNGVTATTEQLNVLSGILVTTAEIEHACDVSTRLVNVGSALTVTQADHEGKVLCLNTASGSVATLPAATGTGGIYRFVVTVTATSNSHIIKVADATDVMAGLILCVSDNSAAVIGWAAGASDDTITFNRTTTGTAAQGHWVELIDVATNLWLVRGVIAATGTEATPFSNTVS